MYHFETKIPQIFCGGGTTPLGAYGALVSTFKMLPTPLVVDP